MTSSRELEPLLDHAAWVRRLAGRLARDAGEAEDLVQETWLSLLLGRARPAPGTGRRLLATVLRRRALEQRRALGRRRAHEGRAELAGDAPAAAELVLRAERGRELARLALELEEPFRAAILLCYFDDLAPAAIAERLGVPQKTVESRLARGHARLRERWLRLFPGRGDARSALVLLAGGAPPPAAAPVPAGASPLALGTLLVNTKLLVLALAAVAGGGVLWLAVSLATEGHAGAPPAEVSVAPEAPPPPLRPPADAAPRPLVAPSADSAREAVASAAPAPAPARPSAPASLRRLRGRVVDPEAVPVAGVAVVFRAADEGELARATSGPGGAFELSAPARAGEVLVDEPALENLFHFRPRPESEPELLLVVARHRALSGRVLDEDGTPVAGARVALALPPEFQTRFDAVFDLADRRTWTAASAADGSFALERVPVVVGARVEARLEGWVPAELAAPEEARSDLELVLRRPANGGDALVGHVSDADGRAVAGALVSLGARSARSGSDGGFQLERTGAEQALELVAVRAGRLPARWRAAVAADGTPLWPAWIELVLGAAPLELSGTVVDQDGHPRADLELWLADPTPFGTIEEDLAAQLENLCAPEDSTYLVGSDAYFRETTTDEAGRFRLQGLLPREYRLGLLDMHTLERHESEPLAAGRSDVRLVFPRAPARRFAGRLVSRSGHPVAGAHVTLNAPEFGGVHQRKGETVSDAEGRFAFEGVAGRELALWITGDAVVPDWKRIEGDSEQELELTVDALCHLKVDLSDHPDLADAVSALDAAGQGLDLYQIGSGGVLQQTRFELVAGRSITLGVSDRAATLVLLEAGVEVERVPLALTPGRLEHVRP